MFKEISKIINENITLYVVEGYYDKVFIEGNVSDKFYIVLDKKYAIEIIVNYQDDIISFLLLKLDPDGKIDKTPGYYKFNDTGSWKRMFLNEAFEKLHIDYDMQLLKHLAKLGQKWNKDFVERLNLGFKAFASFLRQYKMHLKSFDSL